MVSRSAANRSAARKFSSSSSRRARCSRGPGRRAPNGSRGVERRAGSSEVALAHRFPVRQRREALAGVRAHRFQHPEPGGSVFRVAAHEQALGDEPVERVEAGAGDRLRRLHGGAAGEDREAREARFLVVAEQAVAPVDRRAQRLLAGGRVAWPCAETVERAAAGVWRSLRGRAARSGPPRARSPAAARRRAGRSPRPRSSCRRRSQSQGRALARARRTARQRPRSATASRRPPRALAARAAARDSSARPARRAARGWWPTP